MPNQDQYLNYAWHAQKLGATAGQSGYGQHSTSPNENAPNQAAAAVAGAGLPYPAGALNVAGEASGSQSVSILSNPGYATGNGTLLGNVTAPAVPATTVGIQNPFGLAAQVTLSGGTVSVVATAPNQGGTAGAGTYTTVATASPAQVTIPPGGWIKLTYTVAPTWAWVTLN